MIDHRAAGLQRRAADQGHLPERDSQRVPRSERRAARGGHRSGERLGARGLHPGRSSRRPTRIKLKAAATARAAGARVRLLGCAEGQRRSRHAARTRSCARPRTTARSPISTRRTSAVGLPRDARGLLIHGRRRARVRTAGGRRWSGRHVRRPDRGRAPVCAPCSSTSGPTLGGQIFKQPGPGFRVTDPKALGRQWRFGPRPDRRDRGVGGRRSCLRTSVVSLEPDPAVAGRPPCTPTGSRCGCSGYRGSCWPRARTTGRSSSRAGRCPG